MYRQLTDLEETALEAAAVGQVLTDVPSALANLARNGKAISAEPGMWFVRGVAYLSVPENGGGVENHFQGCQILADGGHMVISGGDPYEPMSHLFVIRLPSTASDAAPARVVARVNIDETHWHAGGIDRCGDVVVVPVECSKEKGFWGKVGGFFGKPDPTPKCKTNRSLIVFYSLHDPTRPVRIEPTITRPDHKATAVAFARWRGKYLLVVLNDKKLDFYRTRDGRLSSGFDDMIQTVPAPVKIHDSQCVNLLRTESQLYLIGFDDKGFLGLNISPTLPGANNIYAYRVIDGPDEITLESIPVPGDPFCCLNGRVNFDAGVALDSRANTLSACAVFHFRDSDTHGVQLARFG